MCEKGRYKIQEKTAWVGRWEKAASSTLCADVYRRPGLLKTMAGGAGGSERRWSVSIQVDNGMC